MTSTARCPSKRVLPSLGVLGRTAWKSINCCKSTTCPQVLETCPSFLPLLGLQLGHGSCPPTREVPPVSPCFPPRAQRFQSVILCFPPTAHPQHLSLCSKLIRLSPKIKPSPAVCCAVKMRGCEPHHAPLSLKRQQKSRRRRYGFCEHHCGSCLTPETPSPEQGEGRKTTPALSPPISFPPCCPSMPCQCQRVTPPSLSQHRTARRPKHCVRC